MYFQDGYIPDRVEAEWAIQCGRTSDHDRVLALAAPWDAEKLPPVVVWESFKTRLMDIDGGPTKNWWDGVDVAKLFTASQGSRPNCAGFAMANAFLVRLLIQRKQEYSEQTIEKVNPMATWVLSKGGSLWGGQTISAIMEAGRNIGNFPSRIVGEYDQSSNWRQWKNMTSEAEPYQVCFSIYDDDATQAATYIMEACRKGYSIVIGNGIAVAGTRKDSRGVMVAELGGSWSHATAFGGWQKVDGVEYVFWINSHGDIYPADDGTPDFGCWMDMETLNRFCSSRFCDLAFVLYAESPYDNTIVPTLNPEVCCA
ncbi:MAG: hypothetical protein Q4D98_03480 [Planctomycetia bacterium]|nr:hypothetical protein [Planctomycetia bacterium]